MPLYEFRCESCGWTLETILAFSDPLPSTCEACGGALKKLLSPPAFHFKGSGWYLTDYARAGGGGEGKDGTPEAKKDGAAPAAAAEKAPAGGSTPTGGSGDSGTAAKSGDA